VEISTNTLKTINTTDKEIDVIIVDPFTIAENAKFWLEQLKLNHLKSKIIVLTNNLDLDLIMSSIEKGLYAYFSKDDCPNELKNVMNDLDNHQFVEKTYFSQEVKKFLVNNSKTKIDNFSTLSKRELEILKLICEERTNVEISQILNLSVRTVESHRRRMIEKTESKSIIGVILTALRFKHDAYKVLWETKYVKQLKLYQKAQ